MIDYKVLATSQRHRPLANFWRARFSAIDRERPERAAPAVRQSRPLTLTADAVRALDALAGDPLGRVTVVTAALAAVASSVLDRETVVIRTPLLADDEPAVLNGDGELPLVLAIPQTCTVRQLLAHVSDTIEQSYSLQDFPLRAMLGAERGARLDRVGEFSLSASVVHAGRLPSPSLLHVTCDDLDAHRLLIEWDPEFVDAGTAAAIAAALDAAIAGMTTRDAAVRDLPIDVHASSRLREATVPVAVAQADAGEARSSRPYVSPRGREELALVRIWQDVFNLDRIGVHDDFFELGGHSLRAMQMVMRVHQALGVEISLNDIFRATTIAALAGVIRRAAPSSLAPIQPLPRAEHYAVSPGQKRLWLLNQIEEDAATYNVAAAFLLTGELDIDALERAFNRLVARHESLRTTFLLVDEEPRQRIAEALDVRLRRVNASAALDPESEARDIARADARGPFDLTRGPLMRATVITLSPSRAVLALAMHHIVTDEWSFGVIIEDLVELYRRERSGVAEPLPALPIQYKDFAAWQQALLDGEASEPQRRFWLETLGGELAPLDLPADFPRSAIKSNAGSRHRFSIDAPTTKRLRALGAAHDTSLFTTLIAIVTVLLRRYTGCDDIRVGVPIAGRKQIELADQVGFYLNTLVLRNRIEASQPFEQVLDRVAATAAAAYDHDAFPFDRVIEALDTDRTSGRLRLFDVLVVQGDTARPRLAVPGLSVAPFEMPVDVSKFDLSVHVDEDDAGLHIELQYDSDLFLPSRIARMQEHVEALIAGVLASPAMPIADIHIGSLMQAAAGTGAPSLNSAPASAFAAPTTGTEATLARIWSEALGLSPIGVHDNFFELGGDSIVALQIVARAAKTGVHITLKQLFRTPTIAELARHAVAATAPEDSDISPAGELPLTPIARWFFDLAWPNPSHFNQSVLLETPADLDAERLARAVEAVFARHDAFRLRFARGADGWHARVDADAEPVAFSREAAADEEQLAARCDELQRRLDLTHGPLSRVALFTSVAGESGRLFIVIHHAAVDGVSWRVLLDDLQNAYEQLAHQHHVDQLPATLSFRGWVTRLQTWAAGADAAADAAYWLQAAGHAATPLPLDLSVDGARNTVATEDHATIRFEPETTAALLRDVPRAYNTQINDALLTALAQALTSDAGRRSVRIDLEGHGRLDPIGDADLSRTTGWFTSMFPITIELPDDAGPGDALKTVKETLRRVPSSGLSYGALRYLAPDPEIRRALAALPVADIRFNYLGQLDSTLGTDGWRTAAESTGASQDPSGRRGHLLDVVARVERGRLEVDWLFSHACHRRGTIEAIAARFERALLTIVGHCADAGAGGFTPSDFPAATITQPHLDRLVAQLSADGVARGQIADVYDLTPTQEGLLFHSALADEPGVYVEQWLLTISGELDADRLRRAWRRTCDRHAALRTAFAWRGLDRPVQVVVASVDPPWTVLDWRSRSDAERDGELRAFLERDRRDGFDLARAPVFRCTLIRSADDVHVLCWSSHHILMDGWSRAIVLQDAIAEYERDGRGDALPPARPFRDYVEWLRAEHESGADAYWRELLADFSQPTTLPAGTPADSSAMPRSELRLTAGETRALTMFARRHHLTLNTLTTAAWALLLGASSGSLDVVCGATVAGRPPSLDGADSMVGLFINTLPLRVQLDPAAPLLDWLRAVQQQQADLGQFADSALVDVQRASGVPRGQPLFDSIVVFENYPVERSIETAAARLRVSDIAVHEQTNYPLTFSVLTDDEGLLLRLNADPSRYSAADAAALLERVRGILADFAAAPDSQVRDALSRLGLAVEEPAAASSTLTEDERRLLLQTFNDTARDWGAPMTIVQLMESQAARHPNRIAVVAGAASLTYGQLHARANALARLLARDHGVGPDVLVGVMAERSPEMVVSLLAILKAGGAYVPIDPDYPSDRIAFMLADSGVAVLLAQRHLLNRAASFSGQWLCVDDEDVKTEEDAGSLPSRVNGEHLAYMIYTSGSTGRPKGAMNTHRGIANRLLWMQDAFALDESDSVLQKTPFSFDVSVWEFFWPLMTGARLVMAAPGAHGDSRYLLDLIERERITTLHFVPSMLNAFIEEPDLERCRGIRRVICSGEAITPALLRRYESRLAAPLFNLYGPTEAAVDVTWWPCRSSDVQSVVPIGKPIANTTIYILDAALQPLPLGAAGELFIGGVGVGRGYLNRPELTAEKFLTDPFTPGGRLYRTGDLARFRRDGNIEYLGRLDHQVKLRGFRIELGEIESALLAHPSIRECVVTVREDRRESKQLVAYVVPRGASAPTAADLRAYLSVTLPPYMLPSAFVALTELPKLPNGKIDRRALPEPDFGRVRSAVSATRAGSPAFTDDERAEAPRVVEGYIPPRTAAERSLTAIWQELLGLAPIGAGENFFELGGHSILALRLMGRVQEAFGRQIPLATLFAHPTIEQLAEAIQRPSDAADWRPLVPIRSGRVEPPLFLLPGAGGNVIYFYALAHALAPRRAVYGLQAIGLDGVTPPLTSVPEIAAANVDEMLRAGFVARGDVARGFSRASRRGLALAGHSFGGKVALEMSQLLRARGEDVRLLAIFDTPAPIAEPIEEGRGWQDAHWLAKIAREIEEFFGIALGVSVDQLLPLTLDAQLDLVMARMRAAGFWAPGANSTALRGYLQVYKANTQSTYVRREAEARVPIALFKTRQQGANAENTPPSIAAVMQEPAWGWDRFADGDVRIYDVPGDHLSMLSGAHAGAIARALDDLLR